MIIGALLDAGLDPKFLEKELKKLTLSGYKLNIKKTAIGTHMDVGLTSKGTMRTLKDIIQIIYRSSLDKDVKKNILIVSQDSNRLIRTNKRIVLSDVNWISDYPCQSDLDQCKSVFPYKCQIRYHGELLPCRIKIKSRNQTSVEFEQSVLASSGQSLVVYNKNICLGGGVIF